MKRQFRASQYNRSQTDPEIASRDGVPTPAPMEIVQQDQGMAQLDPSDDQLFTDDLETLLLSAIPYASPADHTLQSAPPIHQVSFADEETLSLNSMPDPSLADDSPVEGPSTHQALITEQATSAPDVLSDPSPVKAPSQSSQQRSFADKETLALGSMPHSSPTDSSPQSEHLTDQDFAVNQETVALAAIHSSPPELETNRGGLLRRIVSAGLTRLQEPQPEGPLTRGIQVVQADLGSVPLLALTNASGLLIVSLSYYLSVLGYSYAIKEVSFLGGLLLIFVPNLLQLLSRSPSRLERIGLLCILGIAFYFVSFMNSPLHFSAFDDFLHWRTADDILRTGHLFSENSMLPVSPYYPGLEIVTNAISTTTGLNTFYAGVLVINISHFLMVLALFLLYEHITGSSRMASIAVLIYMTNQHFTFFDTIYSYETMALPLAIFMLYILVRYAHADKNHRWVITTAWIVLAAITITHHMTDYFFDGLLLLWAIVSFFRPVSRRFRSYLATIAISGVLLSLAYAFLLPNNPVWNYLTQYFGSSFTQLEQIITGTIKTRPLFTNTSQTPPLWDRLFITGSVALVMFALPFGLLSLLRRHRENALAFTLGIISLAYPLVQAFRFTTFGTEITDRAAAFLFLPIAYVLTIFITHFWPTRKLSKRAISLISSALIVILLGGVLLATGPNLSDLAGPYQVGADGGSVEPEGIEAASWTLAHLGPNNRIATDRTNQMLLSTYGDQRIVTRLDDNVDVAPLFYSAQFDNSSIALLKYGQIQYLVVDIRLSTALPAVGIYFENDSSTSIISNKALTKFNTVTQINRLFDSGDIVIYDAEAFISGASP